MYKLFVLMFAHERKAHTMMDIMNYNIFLLLRKIIIPLGDPKSCKKDPP